MGKTKEKKVKKVKEVPIDGLSPKDIAKIRTALRRVWSWSYARRLCIKRALTDNEFSICEECKTVVAKIYPDHIIPCGDMDDGFLSRLFCPSSGLQALCKKCHQKKTNAERRALKE